jgi:hypothetical protein
VLQLDARRFGLFVGLVAMAATAAHALDKYDFLKPQTGTAAVALMGGDTPQTFTVSCSSNTLAAGATLLVAAQNAGAGTGTAGADVLTRPLRKRCFQNLSSAEKVNIGSSTVATSDFWTLGESTNSAISPAYCTQNSGAFYCAPASPATAAATVNILVEIQSVP